MVSVSNVVTNPIMGYVVSSIEGVQEKVDATSVQVIPSSQDPTASQSGSDSQNQVAKVEKDAKAALHQIESVTGVSVSSKY